MLQPTEDNFHLMLINASDPRHGPTRELGKKNLDLHPGMLKFSKMNF